MSTYAIGRLAERLHNDNRIDTWSITENQYTCNIYWQIPTSPSPDRQSLTGNDPLALAVRACNILGYDAQEVCSEPPGWLHPSDPLRPFAASHGSITADDGHTVMITLPVAREMIGTRWPCDAVELAVNDHGNATLTAFRERRTGEGWKP